MAVVFFAFVWLSPQKENVDVSDDPASAATEQQQQIADQENLSSTEMEWLRNNLAANGDVSVNEEGKRVYAHSDENMSLMLTGDSISGYVNIKGTQYPLSDILQPGKVDINVRNEALSMIRETSTSMGKYGKFAKFLVGNDSI